MPARADVSSWFAFGGGYGVARDGVASDTSRATTMSMSLGVGSSPRAKLVGGGLLRTVTFFSLGTDLSLGPRFCTGGFARGQWGLAVDAGVVGRFWNDGAYGRFPVQGIVTLGAPWGVQLGLGAQAFNLGSGPSAASGFAVLEIDLLRLTVMRQGATDSTWPNPSPAGGRDRDLATR
ncbi:MAG: hypothetical protein JWM74_4178 [Myxococcaceae bacterium]|nr:hypothetical protein [Myxococcaceae bacterium]